MDVYVSVSSQQSREGAKGVLKHTITVSLLDMKMKCWCIVLTLKKLKLKSGEKINN